MSKLLFKSFLSLLSVSLLSILTLNACIDSDDDENRQAVMCTEANGGTGCYEYLTSCGTEAIGTYENKEQCEADRSEVEAYYDQFGEYTLGSNALYAGAPDDNSGSSDGGSGSGSGNLNCDLSNIWSGVDDVQIYSQCQGACVYADAGNQQGVDATCSILQGWGAEADCSVC